MANVVWRREALDDLRAIIDYIAHFDPIAADGFGRRLYDLGEGLETFPRRGRPCGNGARELTTVSPYILRYELSADQVVVLSIRHGARNDAMNS